MLYDSNSFASSAATKISASAPWHHDSQREHAPFNRRPCESSITRLSDAANRFAISRAASSLRSCKKPLFWRTASPMSSALRASPCARTMMDCTQLSGYVGHICYPKYCLPASPEWPDRRGRLHAAQFVGRPMGRNEKRSKSGVETGLQTCFASTACVNSGEKATCVIETSSRTMLKRIARLIRFSRTSLDT